MTTTPQPPAGWEPTPAPKLSDATTSVTIGLTTKQALTRYGIVVGVIIIAGIISEFVYAKSMADYCGYSFTLTPYVSDCTIYYEMTHFNPTWWIWSVAAVVGIVGAIHALVIAGREND